jgi:hypothetical protein
MRLGRGGSVFYALLRNAGAAVVTPRALTHPRRRPSILDNRENARVLHARTQKQKVLLRKKVI